MSTLKYYTLIGGSNLFGNNPKNGANLKGMAVGYLEFKDEKWSGTLGSVDISEVDFNPGMSISFNGHVLGSIPIKYRLKYLPEKGWYESQSWFAHGDMQDGRIASYSWDLDTRSFMKLHILEVQREFLFELPAEPAEPASKGGHFTR